MSPACLSSPRLRLPLPSRLGLFPGLGILCARPALLLGRRPPTRATHGKSTSGRMSTYSTHFAYSPPPPPPPSPFAPCCCLPLWYAEGSTKEAQGPTSRPQDRSTSTRGREGKRQGRMAEERTGRQMWRPTTGTHWSDAIASVMRDKRQVRQAPRSRKGSFLLFRHKNARQF